MYQHLNSKEILDSLAYYKYVLQLGNLHGDLLSHLHGSMLKISLYTTYALTCTPLYQLGADRVPNGYHLSANLVPS